MTNKNKITPEILKARKGIREKIKMVTAYDSITAKLLAAAARIEVLWVSDLLGVTQLGYSGALPVTLEEMLHHTKAVSRSKVSALIVAQMPYLTYELNPTEAARNAGRLVKEGGADAVCVKGGVEILNSLGEITRTKIAVMGHLQIKKVDAKSKKIIKEILEAAKVLENAGCFALLLENLPSQWASLVTKSLNIPTIGFRSGSRCDGEVLI